MNITDKIEKKVFRYIEDHGMIERHDRIVAGVSGGADSVCLLLLLQKYAGKVPFALSVVHVNHGIRAEAGEDAGYVEAMCAKMGIPFSLTAVDVHGLALAEKCSEEDMGRRVRYEAFRRAAEETGSTRIAVAHNSNDNAETMLFHLFRGSGMRGMCGIAPVREDGTRKIIRPVLCLERWEVEAYLRERQVHWCMDGTNNGDGYCRNRIRHHILPYAEREIAAGAVEHMRQSAEMLREAEDFLEQQAGQALRQCLAAGAWRGDEQAGQYIRNAQYVMDAETFRGFHTVLQKRMALDILEHLSPTGKDISRVHVQSVVDLFYGEGNKQADLPCGISAWRQYGRVIIKRGTAEADGSGVNGVNRGEACGEVDGESRGEACGEAPREGRHKGGPDGEAVFIGRHQEVSWDRRPVAVPVGEEIAGSGFVCPIGNLGKMEFRVFEIQMEQKFPQNQYTKWFDYDRIEESLVVRTRNKGDYLTIADREGKMIHKTLKDYMITEKIPRQIRDEIPVLAAGNHILWLPGWRISEYFKVSKDTKRILQVKIGR